VTGKIGKSQGNFFFFFANNPVKVSSTQNKNIIIIIIKMYIDLFQRLFRQDLLVASLFRNFLLAERILRSYDCTPVSSPKLPPTYQVKKN